MTLLSARPVTGSRFRHVVFAGAGSPGRVLNFAPAATSHRTSHYLTQRESPSTLSPEEMRFVDWLFASSGVEARAYRSETLRRRLNACLRVLRVASPHDALLLLEKRPDLVPAALNAILIGVTSFFRDAAVFDQLTYEALPFLAMNAGKSPLRVWSVGCSSGEELYSIAILLAEMGMLEQATLLGTDCRTAAVRQARQGVFEARALDGMPAEWTQRYFEPRIAHHRLGTLTRYQICERIRAATQWRTADATRLREPGTWDLVFCRNLAMYFHSNVSGQLWESLEQSLRPGGYLVLGKAERPSGARTLSWVGPCIYRRTLG